MASASASGRAARRRVGLDEGIARHAAGAASRGWRRRSRGRALGARPAAPRPAAFSSHSAGPVAECARLAAAPSRPASRLDRAGSTEKRIRTGELRAERIAKSRRRQPAWRGEASRGTGASVEIDVKCRSRRRRRAQSGIARSVTATSPKKLVSKSGARAPPRGSPADSEINTRGFTSTPGDGASELSGWVTSSGQYAEASAPRTRAGQVSAGRRIGKPARTRSAASQLETQRASEPARGARHQRDALRLHGARNTRESRRRAVHAAAPVRQQQASPSAPARPSVHNGDAISWNAESTTRRARGRAARSPRSDGGACATVRARGHPLRHALR